MQKFKHTITTTNASSRYYPILLTGCFILSSQAAYAETAQSEDLLGITGITTNNQFQVGDTINVVCPSGVAEGTEFQDRCNALVGARQGYQISDQQLTNILGQVTSEQSPSQSTQSLEMNTPQTSNLSNRISLIRSGRQKGGLKLSGLMFDSNGKPISTTQLAKLNDTFNKAAAGDSGFDRLGVFINGNIGYGNRSTTVNEAGYNLDTHGATAGADYRIGDNFLVGLAFSYDSARTGFLNSLGKMESDSYTGAVYGSFFTQNGFFMDGIFSGSHINYATTRNIQYNLPAETIQTQANGNTQGNEFEVAMTTGYNFSLGALTLTPQVRIDYTTSQVDALNEQGGQGWALHIAERSFESLQTAPGLQLSYAINSPWAVILPMVRAEYIHEFQNNARNISAYFIQDPSKTSFVIMTDNPDRDYIVASAGLSAQFAHGISAFVNYDTVQAHSYVNNHNFSGGMRLELSF